ncbi:MAG: hypothetical protein HXX11_23625 [Desulfuromonadales bacterium]|nr:hypothetical protein [Desulfuromonadales bacterium]
MTEKQNLQKEDPKDWEKWRNNLYHLKLTGFLWFKDVLPVRYNGELKIHFNIHRMEEPPPDGVENLEKLGTPMMEYLCNIMANPDWVNIRQRERIFLLSEMIDMFDDNLFGLPKLN